MTGRFPRVSESPKTLDQVRVSNAVPCGHKNYNLTNSSALKGLAQQGTEGSIFLKKAEFTNVMVARLELKGKPTGCLARGQSIDDDLRQSEHNSTAESEGLNKLLALGPKNDRPNGLTRTKKKGDQFLITPFPGSSH
ncbi:hypothetical protein HYE67_001868 [Fusarium culmorum]|uniref:Uncharacterized protein n=1 Tax=Fusarium culmorum TaxID=5516 RepID=A0A7S8HSD6_FUSCU|nr:hypothetical protein HYE67_001868 [Fusarium culmorum]